MKREKELQRSLRMRSESTNRRNPTTREVEVDLKRSGRIKRRFFDPLPHGTTSVFVSGSDVTSATAVAW